MVELVHSGKVRDLYADGDDLILVASDRVSVYDVVLPTPIPDKGAILTQLSLWWFERLADVMPNHVISADDVPAEFAGRAIRCRRLSMVPVVCGEHECPTKRVLARDLLTAAAAGVPLAPGLVNADRHTVPVSPTSTKAPIGQPGEPIPFATVVE